MNTNNRRKLSTPSRIALSVLAILASAADAQAVTEWDLPGQPLANTLRDIAARTESNIIFDKKLVKNQSAPPLKTRATTEEALSKVLEGTGLTYRQLDDKTVTIQLASTDPAAATSYASATDGRIRLAQAQAGTRSEAGPSPAEQGLPSVMLLEEIIVTGTNIRGIENNTAPVTVLTREYINATGYSTVTKLIESLPQNFALANESTQVTTPGVSVTREQGSSVNLRGIGEGTTLVLLNGRRLAPGYRSAAVDISSLPLSAIERVEILPDGASALYGSDAVGGVINFILRDDFEGAETRLRAGMADGVDEYRASQAVGNSWDSGNALFSVEYFKRDQLSASDRDFVPANALVSALIPESEVYSGMFTGKQDLSGSVSVFADGLYSKRESQTAGRATFAETADIETDQIATTLGVGWNVAGDWQIQLTGSYAENSSDQVLNGRQLVTLPLLTTLTDITFDSQSAELKADGTLFSLPGGKVSVAIGGGYRQEAYEENNRRAGAIVSRQDVDQDIASAFAEMYVPIFGEGNAVPGIRRLEISLAGRYDDYSSAGSSTDPQGGLMWEPVNGFRLRARYGTSYKAPNLFDYNLTNNNALSVALPVPGRGTLQVLSVRGTAVDTLQPQEAETASFGLEFRPEAISGLGISVNYYDIRYENIIATPGAPAVLYGDPATYGDLLTFNPSVAQVNAAIALGQLGQGFRALLPNGQPNPAFTPASVQLIVDGRRRNLSLVSSSGLDLATEYNFAVGPGRLFFGINGTYVLNRDQQVTDNGREIDTADTIYNPPSWRARGLVSYQQGGFGANLFVNHTDSYTDNRATTLPAQSTIDSLTTLDLRFAYDFSSRFQSGLLSGFSVALSAQNVLDEDPPRVAFPTGAAAASTYELGFDPINADPLGRLIALEFTKSW